MSESATLTPPLFPDPIPGIIPFGTLTMFAGAPGVGKTTMIAEWIERWRKGREIWGHATNAPNQFAYIAADRHWASHQYWFNRVGFPEIPHYSLVDDIAFDLKQITDSHGAIDLFKRCLNVAADGYPPVPGALVVVDPAVPLFIQGSQNNPRDVAHSLLSIGRIARERQYTIILVGHFGKQKSDGKDTYTRPQDRIAGSYAFSGFSDTQIYLVGPEGDQAFTILGWNPRKYREQMFQCVRDEATGLFMPYDKAKDDTTVLEVLDCLDPSGVVTLLALIRERAQQKGHSRATVHRSLEQLLKNRMIARLGRGRYMKAKLH